LRFAAIRNGAMLDKRRDTGNSLHRTGTCERNSTLARCMTMAWEFGET
jgi:hypothetical protein